MNVSILAVDQASKMYNNMEFISTTLLEEDS